MRVDEFTYDLPESAIAQQAVEPRHAARLLDTRDLSDHRFIDLPSMLDAGDLVVVNETKVRSARLIGHKSETGGQVELLILSGREDGLWEAMVRPARRLRPGTRLSFEGIDATIVSGPEEGVVAVELHAEDVEAALEAAGEVPLPPYFTGSLDDPGRYQTMFATTLGSAAAPTAGLHFTPEVVAGLEDRGVDIAKVDLHVGIDTFRPIKAETIDGHSMHAEWCTVPEPTAEAIANTRRSGGRVVAVGTTTVRTLETFAHDDGTVEAGAKETDIFLKPGSRFKAVDVMVTNFHVPGSTLVVLVAGFMGAAWKEAYATALDRGYRFLSFGDAMLCERADA